MKCNNCGTKFDGAYCPKCGTKAEANTEPSRSSNAIVPLIFIALSLAIIVCGIIFRDRLFPKSTESPALVSSSLPEPTKKAIEENDQSSIFEPADPESSVLSSEDPVDNDSADLPSTDKDAADHDEASSMGADTLDFDECWFIQYPNYAHEGVNSIAFSIDFDGSTICFMFFGAGSQEYTCSLGDYTIDDDGSAEYRVSGEDGTIAQLTYFPNNHYIQFEENGTSTNYVPLTAGS